MAARSGSAHSPTSAWASTNLCRSTPTNLLTIFDLELRTSPGIIALLAGILAKHKISLDAVLQLPAENWRDLPFVITTEPTTEQAIRTALNEMSSAGLSDRVAIDDADGDAASESARSCVNSAVID